MKSVNSASDDALFLACQNGSLEDFDKLINDGSDPNTIDAFTSRRPIHVAVRNGNTDIVKRLVNDLHVNLDVIDGGCWTPLLLAQHLSYNKIYDIIANGLNNSIDIDRMRPTSTPPKKNISALQK